MVNWELLTLMKKMPRWMDYECELQKGYWENYMSCTFSIPRGVSWQGPGSFLEEVQDSNMQDILSYLEEESRI